MRDVPGEVAVLHDWDSWWASGQEGRPSALLDYTELVQSWHRALWETGTATEFARPDADLSRFRMVAVPQLYLLSDTAINNLVGYVRGGGTLVCGFFSGVADVDDRIRPGGMDERLRELFGIRTLHEWWPFDADTTVECDGFRAGVWSEELEADPGTEIISAYRGGELDGLPAVLRRDRAYYVSTLPEPEALRALLGRVAAEAGAGPVLAGLPEDVEAVRRGELLFLLHHGRGSVTVPVPGPHVDLLTGEDVDGLVELGRYGVAVLRSTTP
ncbi:hypothetical protein GCM10018966_017440 [Streptomyces yanii]